MFEFEGLGIDGPGGERKWDYGLISGLFAWDYGLISGLFAPEVVVKIWSIPLSLSSANDGLFWQLTNNSIFIVKTFYWLGLLGHLVWGRRFAMVILGMYGIGFGPLKLCPK